MEDYSQIYHVFTKSIAGFHVYRRKQNFIRMVQIIRYYQHDKIPMPFSDFRRLPMVDKGGFDSVVTDLAHERKWGKRIDVLAYCLMNTHLHLIVRELQPGVLSMYMSDILNSYTRYFNNFYQRKGPLWQSRFGRFSIANQENLLRTADYVHFNPVKAGLVGAPEQWQYSSYRELIKPSKSETSFCVLNNYLDTPTRTS